MFIAGGCSPPLPVLAVGTFLFSLLSCLTDYSRPENFPRERPRPAPYQEMDRGNGFEKLNRLEMKVEVLFSTMEGQDE